MSKSGPASKGAQSVLDGLAARELSINAYSKSKEWAGGRLSRVIRGELPCTREMALVFLRDFGTPIEAWDEPPQSSGRAKKRAAARAAA